MEREGRAILDVDSLTLPEGVVAIIGPSGAGKSTMLRLLNRLIVPEKGRVFYRDEDLSQMDPRDLRRRVGMVFQVPIMFEGTVLDNISYGPRLAGVNVDDPEGILRLVSLPEDHLGRDASKLSVGEQQRVAIARALANSPEVLLMDEPTSALDPGSTRRVEQMIKKIGKRVTVILVSHDLKQAEEVATHCVVMECGLVTRQGSAEEAVKGLSWT